MQLIRIFSVLGLALVLNACSSGLEQPKGTSKGYHGARFVRLDPNAPAITDPTEKKVHRMIQNSITGQFTSNGLQFNTAGADLVVAYLVIYQDNAMTTYFSEYFGSGRNAEEISDLAHERGVIKGQRADYFERAGLVVDVINASTNKLVYRNVWVGDMVRDGSDANAAQRVNAAVNTALAPFFK